MGKPLVVISALVSVSIDYYLNGTMDKECLVMHVYRDNPHLTFAESEEELDKYIKRVQKVRGY